MLRMIWITIYTWFVKPFRKPKQTTEWGNPTTTQPELRDKGQPLPQAVTEYRIVQGTITRLKKDDLTTQPWQRLLKQRGSHSGRDTVAMVVGSPAKLLSLFYDFLLDQQPSTTSLGLLVGSSCTPVDLESLEAREMENDPWVRHSEGTGIGSVFVEHPAPVRIVTQKIGNIATTGGNGGDMSQALRNLETDPLTEPDLRNLVGTAARALMDYDSLGYGLVTIEGGGGTNPHHQYAVDLLETLLTINRHYRLFLMPTNKEPLHLSNMRGILANVLKNEAIENEANGKIPTLNLFSRQKKTGPHATDIALVSGVITLSGASQDISLGEIDPTNKFNLIQELAGNFLTVHPRILELPLKQVGRVVPHNGHLYDQIFPVSVPDELGGKRVSAILKGTHELVMEDPSAPHFIAISASLLPREIEYITKSVERFSLNPGGQVHVMLNPIMPLVDPVKNTIQSLLCDFRGGQGVSRLLQTFLAEKESIPLSNGISWDDLRTLADKLPEYTASKHIEEQLHRILNGNDH